MFLTHHLPKQQIPEPDGFSSFIALLPMGMCKTLAFFNSFAIILIFFLRESYNLYLNLHIYRYTPQKHLPEYSL